MARQFIYHMQGLSKTYGSKKVLDNINLSFYPDAKIGVLGPNGSGKSTLLKHHGRHRHRNGPARASLAHGAPASATCRRSRSSIPAKNRCART